MVLRGVCASCWRGAFAGTLQRTNGGGRWQQVCTAPHHAIYRRYHHKQHHSTSGGIAASPSHSIPSALDDDDAAALLYGGRTPEAAHMMSPAVGQPVVEQQSAASLSFADVQAQIADAVYTQGWTAANVASMSDALMRCMLIHMWTVSPCTVASLQSGMGEHASHSCYPGAVIQAAFSLLGGLQSCTDAGEAPSKHVLGALAVLLCISTCLRQHGAATGREGEALHDALPAYLRRIQLSKALSGDASLGAAFARCVVFATVALELATGDAAGVGGVGANRCVHRELRQCISRHDRNAPRHHHHQNKSSSAIHQVNEATAYRRCVADTMDWIAAVASTSTAPAEMKPPLRSATDAPDGAADLALHFARMFASESSYARDARRDGALTCVHFVSATWHRQPLDHPNVLLGADTARTVQQWMWQCKDTFERAVDAANGAASENPIRDALAMPRLMLFTAVVQALVHIYPLASTPPEYRDVMDWLLHTCPHAVAMSCGSASFASFCCLVASTSDTVHPKRLWPLLCANGGIECLAAVDDVIAHLPASDGARTTILDAVQARFGHRATARSAVPAPALLATVPSVGPPPATWQGAVQQVSDMLVATTTSGCDAPLPDVEWRHSLPNAIRLASAAGKYDATIALFDEYAALTHGADLVGGAPLRARRLSLDAVGAFAKAIDRSGRWYRAIDVLDAVGHCSVAPPTPRSGDAVQSSSGFGPHNQDVWASTASSLRSRWEEALRLLEVVAGDGGTPTTRQGDPAVRAVLPFAVEAVSRMHQSGGQWRNAVRYLDTAWDAFNLATAANATHVEAIISMHAWLAPRDAYALACTVVDPRSRGDDGSDGSDTLRPVPPRIKCRALMNAIALQYAQRGHWEAALALTQSPHARWVVHPWDRVATALQHASRQVDEGDGLGMGHDGVMGRMHWTTALCVMQQCPKEVLAGRHSILRLLLRAAENGGWMATYADLLDNVAAAGHEGRRASGVLAEYALWARRVAGAGAVPPTVDKQRHAAPMRLTDTYLVHAACRAPWLHGSRDPSDGNAHHRPTVRFEWTQGHVDTLRHRCRGDLARFVVEVLQLPVSQVHSSDYAKCVSSGGPRIGETWRLYGMGASDPAAAHAVRALVLLRTATGVVVASKPSGADTDAFAAQVGHALSVPLVPLYRLQPATHGLMVLAPVGVPRWQFHLTLYLLLGLRRVDAHALPLASTRFFRKFHMRPFHVVDAGVVSPATDVVMVEATCVSDDVHGPPGTLYALSMDMQLEGWGYCGDAGNAHLEDALDDAARGGRHAADAHDGVLSGRALYCVRELIIRVPCWQGASVEPQQDGPLVSVLHAESPPPRWWIDAGLVPSDV